MKKKEETNSMSWQYGKNIHCEEQENGIKKSNYGPTKDRFQLDGFKLSSLLGMNPNK